MGLGFRVEVDRRTRTPSLRWRPRGQSAPPTGLSSAIGEEFDKQTAQEELEELETF